MISELDATRIMATIEQLQAEHRATTFLFEAVRDIQGTIRAIDTKVGILLAALAIPLPLARSGFDDFHAHGFALSAATAAGWCAFLVYAAAALVAVRALTGIGNAAEHVKGDERPDDLFYAGGLFPLHWIDAILTRRNVRSNRSIENYTGAVPMTHDDVVLHLSHEVLSLAYIRDLKIHRQKIAFDLTAVSVVFGVLALVL